MTPFVYMLQRGVQWKQGVVVYIILQAVLLPPIHCTPLRLHPFDEYPQPTKDKRARKRLRSRLMPATVSYVFDLSILCLLLILYMCIYIYIYIYIVCVFCSGPISVDPICPQPTPASHASQPRAPAGNAPSIVIVWHSSVVDYSI